VLVGIDHFKAHNDCHGHPAGDAVLRGIGTRVRDIDLLARVGGEELGLPLPGCAGDEALEVVERLRRDMPTGLTVSAGIASSAAPMSPEELVAAANRELYRAMAEGRDRARVTAGPGCSGQ
jgi:diguanylate cyclase (GGDEF)-like protein